MQAAHPVSTSLNDLDGQLLAVPLANEFVDLHAKYLMSRSKYGRVSYCCLLGLPQQSLCWPSHIFNATFSSRTGRSVGCRKPSWLYENPT